ncbi:hypothetical protein [Mammaliicoccus sciuri]|uniref:hypothetical protein n=2 Tax=Staphylococcaceae TaxID=90964 RepID=UPI002DB89D47|nr:hypothetical protein [Mammaliicoccus sciuri]MEB8265621.1 hypothetical protein [Mammaliicoccus sciuri]
MNSKKEKAKRPRSDSMKWIYGLLTVCLLFLVACDNQTSKNNEHNDNEKSSETTTTEEKTTAESTGEDVKTKEEKSKPNNNNNQNEQNDNNNQQSTDEIPVEENVNGVKPNNHNETETFDTEAYTVARNCLLNQGNSQAECDKAENTIEFTRAWQNLSRDGYLCNDDGCSLPKENDQNNQGHHDQQHSNTNEDSSQGSNEQSNEPYEEDNNQTDPSRNTNQQDENTNREGQSQNRAQQSSNNETTQSDYHQETQLNKAS